MQGIKETIIFAILVIFPISMEAHPAHAKPVKYPFVVGFERFYTNLDTPDHLASGGLVLLNELNCVACHQPPEHLKRTLTGRPGTRLTGVADRFEHLDLEMMIRNPRFVKTDTIMPSMFSGRDRDRALDEIEVLKHFLSTLKELLPEFPEGDIETGKILYHKIGCVACHAPELDYCPPWIPKSIELGLTGLPSVPMNLADRYPREALIDLILDPSKHRPAGRMPKFDLSQKEAIDIGTYLNSAPKPGLPLLLQKALSKAQPFHPDPEKVEAGRAMFAEKNCMACHPGVVDAKPKLEKALADLNVVSPGGCLSDRPPGGNVPAYGLDELQKKSMVEALKRINETRKDTPEKQIDWILASRNCYSCHDRNHKGGPESAREIFFTVNNSDSIPNGRWATQPPTLEGVGGKLTDEWWKRILYHEGGSGSVRDFMALRMPVYRREDLGDLVQLIKLVDRVDPARMVEGHGEKGHSLVGFDSRNCVACHGLGDLPPPGIPSVNLNDATVRLRDDYFVRLLKNPQLVHPGIPMPNSNLRDEEIANIRDYLSRIAEFPLPDGLLQPDETELVPTTNPMVVRLGVEGWFEDGLAVGFPDGINFLFDIEKSELIDAGWSGRFLNVEKLSAPKLLGSRKEEVQRLGTDFPYRGYRVEEGAVTIICGNGETTVHCVLKSDGSYLIEEVTP